MVDSKKKRKSQIMLIVGRLVDEREPWRTNRGSVAFSLEQVRKAQFAQHGRSVYNHF